MAYIAFNGNYYGSPMYTTMQNIANLGVYFLLSFTLVQNCNSKDHSAVLLANAGQNVAFQPLVNGAQGAQNSSHTQIFEEQAHFDDLATTRLQVRTNDVVDMLWKTFPVATNFQYIASLYYVLHCIYNVHLILAFKRLMPV